MATKTYRSKAFRINLIGVGDINPIFKTDDPEKQAIIESTQWFKSGTIDIVSSPKKEKAPPPAAGDENPDYSKMHIATLRKLVTDAGHDIPKKGINKAALIELLEG